MAAGSAHSDQAEQVRGRLSLDEHLPLRTGLGAAFAGVIGYAQAMVDECERNPVRAVHEYRKALRRARAVLRLARPVMGHGAWRSLVRELRVALRGTSPLRDCAVLLGALDSLAPTRATRAAIAGLREVLCTEQQASQDCARAGLELRRSVQLVAPLPARFVACLPERLRWRDVRASLEKSHRRARAARRRAHGGEDSDVHAFRKRVKELRYQLELLDAAGPGSPRRDHRELAWLAEALGEVTDLMVLRRALRLRAGELTGAEPLVAALDARIAARLSRLFRQSRRALGARPRAFAAHAVRPFR